MAFWWSSLQVFSTNTETTGATVSHIQVLPAAPAEAHLVFRERSKLTSLRERRADCCSFIPVLKGGPVVVLLLQNNAKYDYRKIRNLKKVENKIGQEKSKNVKRFTVKNLKEEINVLSSLYINKCMGDASGGLTIYRQIL